MEAATNAVLTSCSIQGWRLHPGWAVAHQTQHRRRLNRNRGHYLAFRHTGMSLPNLPIAFLLLGKFSHTANMTIG
jgi:hypothetical protein